MKVVIITSHIIDELTELSVELTSRGHSVVFWPLDLVRPDDFTDGSLAEGLSGFDLIYYRSGFTDAGRVFLPELLGSNITKIVNPVVYKHILPFNKLYQAILLSKQGVVMPSSYMGRGVPFDTLADRLGVPFIGKAANGIQGNQVFSISNKQDFDSFLQSNKESDLVWQKFIPNNGDYRVLMIGGEVYKVFKRVAADGDFKNNMYLGAHGEAVTDKDLLNRLSAISKTVVVAMQIEIGGVDIIESAVDGELYFLEVNVNPGWRGLDATLGTNTASAIANYFEDRVKNSITPSL